MYVFYEKCIVVVLVYEVVICLFGIWKRNNVVCSIILIVDFSFSGYFLLLLVGFFEVKFCVMCFIGMNVVVLMIILICFVCVMKI